MSTQLQQLVQCKCVVSQGADESILLCAEHQSIRWALKVNLLCTRYYRHAEQCCCGQVMAFPSQASGLLGALWRRWLR